MEMIGLSLLIFGQIQKHGLLESNAITVIKIAIISLLLEAVKLERREEKIVITDLKYLTNFVGKF